MKKFFFSFNLWNLFFCKSSRLSTEKDKFDFHLVSFCCPLTGKLHGLASVEFSAGIASFSDLSIDHEDKNYILNFEAFTVAPSRYHFSINATPFDVKERILELVITQQPGKACAKTLSSLVISSTVAPPLKVTT